MRRVARNGGHLTKNHAKNLKIVKNNAIIKSRRGTGKLLRTSSECQIGGWQKNWIDQNNSKPQ